MTVSYPEMKAAVAPAVARAAAALLAADGVAVTPGAERAVRMAILREGARKPVDTVPEDVQAVAEEVLRAAREGGPTPEGRAAYLPKAPVRAAWADRRTEWLARLWPEIDWEASGEGEGEPEPEG